MLAEVTWIYLNRASFPAPLEPRRLRLLLTVLVLNIFVSALPSISAAGHFGGGLLGVAAAVCLNTQRFAAGVRRWAALAGVFVLPIAPIGAVAWQRTDDPRWLDLEYQAFDARVPGWLKKTLEDPLRVYNDNVKAIMEDRQPNPPPPGDVARAITGVNDQQQKLALVVQALATPESYSIPALHEADEASLEVVTAARDYYGLAAESLQADDLRRRQPELARQRDSLEQQVRHWRACWIQAQRVRQRLYLGVDR
jgi:hypothetical protein